MRGDHLICGRRLAFPSRPGWLLARPGGDRPGRLAGPGRVRLPEAGGERLVQPRGPPGLSGQRVAHADLVCGGGRGTVRAGWCGDDDPGRGRYGLVRRGDVPADPAGGRVEFLLRCADGDQPVGVGIRRSRRAGPLFHAAVRRADAEQQPRRPPAGGLQYLRCQVHQPGGRLQGGWTSGLSASVHRTWPVRSS